MNKNKVDELIEYIRAGENRVKAFRSLAVRGMITQNLVEKITGLSPKEARNALSQLMETQHPVPPAIQMAGTIRLSSGAGRPEKFYILTSEGSVALQTIEGRSELHAPASQNSVEMLHTFAELQVYAAGVNSGYKALVERVIHYGDTGRNIRPDVLVSTGGNSFGMYEIEQDASTSALQRILSKLRGWREFFQATTNWKISHKICILFHTSGDLASTVRVWQRAVKIVLTECPDLEYEIKIASLADFLKTPRWDGEWFEPLGDEIPLAQEIKVEVSKIPPQVQHSVAISEDFVESVEAWAGEYSLVYNSPAMVAETKQNANRFFRLIKAMYDCSHFRDSVVDLYGARAEASLETLKKYLHDPRNEGLLLLLKKEMKEIYGLQGRVTTFRDGLTRLFWRILNLYGFDRGGGIRLRVVAPEFDGDSEYHVSVFVHHIDEIMGRDYWTTKDIGDMGPEEQALAWLLELLYLNAGELLGFEGCDRNKKQQDEVA